MYTTSSNKIRQALRTGAFLSFAAISLISAVPAQSAELPHIEVGAMYMAYFDLNTSSGVISWNNSGDYSFDGPQVLRPLSQTNPGDYYGGSGAWVDLLNPHSEGGQDAASSRLFGFSLTGQLRSYLNTNGYALAIQLDSITFAGTSDAADNTSVFYYNYGRDDWGSAHPDKVEWSELSASNYLIWNGQSFSNMIHPLVVSTDPFAADYTLTYSLYLVTDTTGANVNATVVNDVTLIGGITPLTFSYTAESLGATAIPEPSMIYGIVAGGAILAFSRYRNRKSVVA